MTKMLEIGKDYAFAMQVRPGTTATYNGGDSWTMAGGGREMTADSPKTTAAVLEYINRANAGTGLR